MITPEQMAKERNKLAKRLNQRMLRLERRGITTGVIQEYKDWVEKFGTSGGRISEKRRAKGISLRAEYFKIQSMLQAPTGTITGWKNIQAKRMKTFESRYGIKFSSGQEFVDFIQSEYFKELSKLYDSKQAIRIVSESKYKPDEIMDRIENFKAKTGKSGLATWELLRSLGIRSKAKIPSIIYENLQRTKS